ncbi:hypothetical protein EYR40_007418 [Pleurotus pulmonarius]|nr:hypothetical protein EYR36_008257 [Pleurotus pulmonarius]KAF4579981.1 hypothetical protein EYR36_001801 [Pleurotus pulmonarius]KAF4596968.1 hypothetical protein EYR40_007418 [Pleurotus pulmonarius]
MSSRARPPFFSTSTPFGVDIKYSRRPSPTENFIIQHVWEAVANHAVIATLVVDDNVVRASSQGTGAVVDCKFVLHYLIQSRQRRIRIRFSMRIHRLKDQGVKVKQVEKRNADTGDVLRIMAKRSIPQRVRLAL